MAIKIQTIIFCEITKHILSLTAEEKIIQACHEKVYIYKNIFQACKWIGIFQFTEKGAQNLAKRAQPNSIIDISAITSIYRPGPLSAGVDKSYVNAVRDPLSIKYEN